MTGIDTTSNSPESDTDVGIPMRDYEAMLRDVGLRPTKHRIALARLMFSQGDRHFTAEMV